MRILSFLLIAAATTVSGLVTGGFCDRYTKAVFSTTTASKPDQFRLIEAVVVRTLLGCNSVNPSLSASGMNCTGLGSTAQTVVPGLLDAASMNRMFFDGTGQFVVTGTGSQALNSAAGIAPGTGGSTRFANITGTGPGVLNPAANALAAHLIQWFGRDLGCDVDAATTGKDTGISAYSGVGDMKAVHSTMAVNKAVWNGFGGALVLAMQSYGVSQTDIDNIIVPYSKTFLRASTGNNQICNQPDCDCATGFSGTNCTPTATRNGTASAITVSPVIIIGAVAAAMLL